MSVSLTAIKKLKINKNNSVFIILILILIVSGLYKPEFLRFGNLFGILRQASALGLLTVGQLFVIVGGGVDLSVAATMQVGITIFTYVYNLYGLWGLVIGIILAFAFGILVGVINGIIVTKYNVQPFLTTLFTGSIITGIRMTITGIKPAGTIPEMIRYIGRDKTGMIPNAVIMFILVVVVCYVVLNKSVYGRNLIAVGTNKIAAKFSGINTNSTIIKSYAVCGFLSILASMVLAGYIGFADQWIGAGYEFKCLIAAVIGGNYLGGGRGSIIGVIGGTLIMTIVLNFVILLGLSAPFQHVVAGLALILALLMGIFTRNK